jgi:hypothetical protein
LENGIRFVCGNVNCDVVFVGIGFGGCFVGVDDVKNAGACCLKDESFFLGRIEETPGGME